MGRSIEERPGHPTPQLVAQIGALGRFEPLKRTAWILWWHPRCRRPIQPGQLMNASILGQLALPLDQVATFWKMRPGSRPVLPLARASWPSCAFAMDTVSPTTRSRIMSAIGQRDTAPERLVRSAAHALGLRFRLCDKKLPGSPDLVFKRHRVAVFVHGCFWHHHECRKGVLPRTRTEYWAAKFARNKARDNANTQALVAAGWTVLELWECEVRNEAWLNETLVETFKLKGQRHRRSQSKMAREA
jgi:DNA mismatch endonuclease, patch repair protein